MGTSTSPGVVTGNQNQPLTTNADIAADLVRQANDHMRERRVLLVASVALGTTTSVRAAIRALREWDGGPAAIVAAAIHLVEQLDHATTQPPPGNTR